MKEISFTLLRQVKQIRMHYNIYSYYAMISTTLRASSRTEQPEGGERACEGRRGIRRET